MHVFIHSVIENRYNFFALWVFHKYDERGCIDKNLHRLMEKYNFAQFRYDFYVNFMIVERGCINKNAHRLMERYNLAQFRRDFNMNFMLSERGCIRKTIHRLVVSIQARSVCLSLPALASCICLSLSVCLCLSVSVCRPLSLSPSAQIHDFESY